MTALYNGGKHWGAESLYDFKRWADFLEDEPQVLGDKIVNRFNQIAKDNNVIATWSPKAGQVEYEGDIDHFIFENWLDQATVEIRVAG